MGDVRPLRYFGEDLVAYRDESGELHVLSGHCKHLGAHIGHGGKVVGDCVECPFHGWRWGPDGTNRYIPYQPDRPNRALRLRVYPVTRTVRLRVHLASARRQGTAVGDARHFDKFPQFETDPDAYYRPYPSFPAAPSASPVHPQIVAENGPDSAHFHYVHGATVTPVCLNWEAVDEEWRFLTGWPDARSDDPDKMALYIHSHFSGLGFAISAFEGSSNHRLIFACTPVEDGCPTCSIRSGGRAFPATPPTFRRTRCASRSSGSSSGTVWEDLDIWRYQEYIEHPALSKVDAKPYMAMRKWATQFYEVPATPPGDATGAHVGMKIDLAELVAPAHTAIVTQECQGAVVGPERRAGRPRRRRRAARRCPTSNGCCPRRATPGVKVVHCLVQRRPDGLGANHNAKIFAIGRRRRHHAPAAEGASCCPNSARQPTDLVLRRWHGIGPMGGTDLDAILRNLGVSTIVAVGVSVNLAITNLVMDAVNKAYRVVVPRDAVAGIPTDYADRSSTTCCRCWRRSPPPTT